MSAYTSLNFTGPRATYTLLDGHGRTYRGHYLLEVGTRNGSSRDDLPSDWEVGGHSGHQKSARKAGMPVGTKLQRCGCGRRRARDRVRCVVCQAQGRRVSLPGREEAR